MLGSIKMQPINRFLRCLPFIVGQQRAWFYLPICQVELKGIGLDQKRVQNIIKPVFIAVGPQARKTIVGPLVCITRAG